MIKLKSTDSYRAKNAPLRIALRRNGVISQKRPAAGGECALHILFYSTRKYCVVIKLKSTDSYREKKRSAEDRTAAEWNHVAKATRRRRRILPWQDTFLLIVFRNQ